SSSSKFELGLCCRQVSNPRVADSSLSATRVYACGTASALAQTLAGNLQSRQGHSVGGFRKKKPVNRVVLAFLPCLERGGNANPAPTLRAGSIHPNERSVSLTSGPRKYPSVRSHHPCTTAAPR